MADSLPDIFFNEDDFIDVYAETGIAVGTALIVQNKGQQEVSLVVQSSKPSLPRDRGIVLSPYDFVVVSSGESGLWGISANNNARVSVQIDS